MVPIGAEQQAPQTEEPQEFNAEAADVQSQISRLIKEREGLSAELGEVRHHESMPQPETTQNQMVTKMAIYSLGICDTQLRDQLMDLKRQRVLELENIQPQRSEFLRRIDAFQSQQEELHRQIWDKLGSFEQPVEGESNGRIGDRARAKGKGTDVEEPVPAYAGPRMPLTPRTVPMEQGFRSEKPSRVTGP